MLQQTVLYRELAAVCIESAEPAEEDLTREAKITLALAVNCLVALIGDGFTLRRHCNGSSREQSPRRSHQERRPSPPKIGLHSLG